VLKKIFVIILTFLFSAILFAGQKKDGSASFYFNIPNGYIEYTNIYDQSKTGVNFTEGKSMIDLPPGNYKFQFFSPTYIPLERVITVSREYQSYNINFQKKSGDFLISLRKNSKNEIYFSEEPPDTGHTLKNISILFYKNGKLIKNIYCDSFLEKVNLDFGQYDIFIKNNEKTLMRVQRFPIKEENENYLNIFIKPSEVFMEGTLKIDDMYLGGGEVIFTNVENNSYTLTSDFSGKFSGKIPSGKYKVSVKKFGYSLKKEKQLLYDFTEEDEKFNLNLELEESPSFIEGRIVDEKNTPVSGAEITIKNGEKKEKHFTDNFGKFNGKSYPGLVVIEVKKEGFFSKGLVRRIEKFSTLSNLKIDIKRKKYKISGILSDGIRAIKSEKIDLINSSGVRFASTLSGDNGYFEFLDIPGTEIFNINIKNSNFIPYTSKNITLTKDVSNFNLILKRKSRQVILEIMDESGKPLGNKTISIEGISLSTDSNGITYLATDSDVIILVYENQKKTLSLDEEKTVYKINVN
jgi:hypothetical protein